MSVLDGGLGARRAEGYDAASGEPDQAAAPAPGLTPRVREHLLATTDDVATATDDSATDGRSTSPYTTAR